MIYTNKVRDDYDLFYSLRPEGRFVLYGEKMTKRQRSKLIYGRKEYICPHEFFNRNETFHFLARAFGSLFGVGFGFASLICFFPDNGKESNPFAGTVLMCVSVLLLTLALASFLAPRVYNLYSMYYNKKLDKAVLPGVSLSDDIRFIYLKRNDKNNILPLVYELLYHDSEINDGEIEIAKDLDYILSLYVKRTELLTAALNESTQILQETTDTELSQYVDRGRKALDKTAKATLENMHPYVDRINSVRDDNKSLERDIQTTEVLFMLQSAIDSTPIV